MSTEPGFVVAITAPPAGGSSLEVLVYEDIGSGMSPVSVSAKDVAQSLSTYRDASEVLVRINSRGGSLIDAMAIYNSLARHKGRKVVYVEGVAASSASLIAMAGDDIIISDNALMMIHDPWMVQGGTAGEMRKSAALLDKMRAKLVDIYARRTGLTAETVATMMAEETWMDAEEAVSLGFATAIAPGAAVVALDLSCFKNAPQPINPRGAVAPAPTLKDTVMDLNQFKAYTAEHPEAVAQFIEQGKKAGATDGIATAKTDLKGLIEAAGGDTALAVDAFLAGKPADVVAAVVADRKAQAEAIAKATATKDAEIAALKAQLSEQRPVGHTTEPEAKAKTPAEPADTAKAEWSAMSEDARAAWASEAVYVRARVRELAAV